MKTKIYKISYNEKWSYHDPKNEFDADAEDMVVSAKSAEEAIEKVRKNVLRISFKDDDDPSVVYKVVGFELTGVELKEVLDL